jgi:hypothetical protein
MSTSEKPQQAPGAGASQLDSAHSSSQSGTRPAGEALKAGAKEQTSPGSSANEQAKVAPAGSKPNGANTTKSASQETQSKLSDSDLTEIAIVRGFLVEEWKPKGTLEQELIDWIGYYVFASRRARTLEVFSGLQDEIEELLERIETFRGIRRRMERNAALEKRWKFSRKPRRGKHGA